MSSYSVNNNDEGGDEEWIRFEDSSEEQEEESQWTKDDYLMEAVYLHDTAGVQQALRNGANVNGSTMSRYGSTPLMKACHEGYDDIVRILLDEGANAWSKSGLGNSALFDAIEKGHLSIVEMLLNHDNGLLEIADSYGRTSLLTAIFKRQVEIAHLLLDRGANAFATDGGGMTSLILACYRGADLAMVRRLLAAGVAVEARDVMRCTALHGAAIHCNIDVLRELVFEHNANMLAMDKNGKPPFDFATFSDSADGKHAILIELYGNKLTQEHGRLALHAVLTAAEYLFIEERNFQLPLNPLRIHLQLGKITLQHFRALLSTLDVELIRNRNDSGKLPIHIACQNRAPVEVLALMAEQDAATLHMADYTGALPLHECCCGAVDDSSVRFLVEHGGVGTLAARNQEGALPLHILCGSTNPPFRTIQYMIQSFSGSVAATTTNAGQYPFMIAACESSTASLSVVHELVRMNPDLVAPR
jgi:ankyrin repeat protein